MEGAAEGHKLGSFLLVPADVPVDHVVEEGLFHVVDGLVPFSALSEPGWFDALCRLSV